MIPTHCTEVWVVGSGNLWHLPQEFSKIVFPWAICSAVDVAATGAVAVEAFGVQDANKAAVIDATAMIFFMFKLFD